MPTDLPQPKPQDPAPPRKHWLFRYWSVPLFVALIAIECTAPWVSGRQPDWIWVGLAVAGLVMVLFVRLGLKA